MLLTFLNLVVVTGILVGLVQGITDLYRLQETGDVIVSTLDTKNYIEQSPQIISFIQTLPQVEHVTARYIVNGSIEANYKTRTDPNEKPNESGAAIVGIDPVAENAFSGIARNVEEGSFLAPGDFDSVVVGSQLIAKYSFGEIPGIRPLKNVGPGSVVRITVNGQTREVVIKGILIDKANSPLSSQVFMSAAQLRTLAGRDDYSVNQVAIRLKKGVDEVAFKDLLVRSGVGRFAKVQTFEQAIPNGVEDVKNTFAVLGNAISSVGLVVASITIFIVIFINALTRRKFIGILKGIGISPQAIEVAYLLQSMFYALVGSSIGLIILFGFLVPYISAHPINLPISNTVLVAPVGETLLRVVLLVLATLIAGYIPARMIVKKNTLDSILGRN
ncbi:MAG: MacB protein [Patescibacteria group bacterium]|nr:MacB protein [Patescibacteria group bacterium]